MKVTSVLAIGSMCAAFALGQSTTSGTQSATQSGSGQETSQSGTTNGMSGQNGSGHMLSGILVASGCNSTSMQGAWNNGGMHDRGMNSNGNYGSNSSANMAASTASGAGSSDMNRTTNDMNRTTNATAGRDMNAANTGNSGSGTGATTGAMDRTDNRSGSTAAASADRAGIAGQTGTEPGDMNRSTVGNRSVNTPQTGMADRERGGDTQSMTSGTGANGANQHDRWSAGQEYESGASNTGNWDRACFISPTTTSFILLTHDGRQVGLDDASNQMVAQRLSSTNRVSQKNKIFRVRVNGDTTGDTIHITDIQM